MFTKFSLIVCAMLLFAFSSNGQDRHFQTQKRDLSFEAIDKMIEKYNVYEIESEEVNALFRSSSDVKYFSMELGGEPVVFEMIPSGILDNDYHLVEQGVGGQKKHYNRPMTYSGIVTNDHGGRAALTINDGFIYGYYELGKDTWFIEPLDHMTGDPVEDLFVVYREKDVLPVENATCAVTDLHRKDKEIRRQAQSRSVGECYQIELAIASDFIMFGFYGSVSAVEDRNIGVINNVQNNYIGEFDDDIEFNIVTQFVSSCSSCDPWTNSSAAEDLLPDFRNWANGGNFGVPIDLGELWTRRDFDGTTIGLAYVSGLCSANQYHVLQDFSSNASLTRVLVAHEIGHNFSASHDASGSPFIMAPAVNNTSSWSSDSQDDISAFFVQRTNTPACFGPCGPTDLPDPDFDVLNNNVCEGGQVFFYDKSTPNPTSWEWIFDGGTPSNSTSPRPIVTYNNAGTYSVVLTVTNPNGTETETFSGIIEVGPAGSEILAYQAFDNGLQDWSVQNPDGSNTWTIVASEGSPYSDNALRVDNFNYNASGARDALLSPAFSLDGRSDATLYIDYAYVRFGPGNSDSLVVSVSSNGGQSFTRIFGDTENGTGNFATAPDQSSEFIPDAAEDYCFEGNFGNSCLAFDLSDYLGSDNVVVKIENINGFGNNMYLDRVYVQASCFSLDPPVAAFNAGQTEGCVPFVVDFTDQSTNGPTSWNWTFEGGDPATSTMQNPTVVYLNPGTYSVTLEASNSSGSDMIVIDDYIVVEDIPATQYSYTVNGPMVTFFNQSTGHLSQVWDFGDGNSSTEDSPAHTYDDDGTYIVTLTASNDCGDASFTDTVQIDAQPEASFNPDTVTGCVPVSLQFMNESSLNATDFQWFFEGGNPSSSSMENPEVAYDMAGSFSVTLIASNANGSDTIIVENAVVIQDSTTAAFNYGVNGNEVSFFNESVGASNYQWRFGDGDSSDLADPVHLYDVDSTYEVTLIASGDCGSDTLIQTVEISTMPFARIAYDTSRGCTPHTVHFSDSLSANVDSRMWIFDGGIPGSSTDSMPTVVYEDPGSYNVTLIVTNGFGSDTTMLIDLITVDPLPDAAFAYDQNNTEIQFYNNSQDADDYSWFFGDGGSSTESDPVHDYPSAGIYSVTLVASNDCGQDTAVLSVSIGAPPVAGFEAAQTEGCANFTVAFDNLSSQNAESWEWTFEGGTPASSMDENPTVTWTEAGSYDVTLIATNAEGFDTLTLTDYITVLEEPTADFNFNANGLEVDFTLVASNYNSVMWNFGDGELSSQENPIHLYDNDGDYDVMLTVYGDCDTLVVMKQVSLQTAPIAAFEASATEGCVPMTVEFENLSSDNADDFLWDFGDGNTSTEENPTHVYTEPGTYQVELVANNSTASDTSSLNIDVLSQPTANFDVTVSQGEVTIDNMSQNAEQYMWDFGNDSTSTQEEPVANYDANGNYEITLIATNQCGSDTMRMDVMINIDAIDDPADASKIILYPNPASDWFAVKWQSTIRGEIDWQIVDFLGRTVLAGSFEKHAESHTEIIRTEELSSAAYILRLSGQNFRSVHRIILK